MKKVVLLIMAVAFTGYAMSQKINDSEVPAAVKNSFEKSFPGSKAKWEKEKEKYEAEFSFRNDELSAVFDAEGKILEREKEIPVTELPKGVTEYLEKNLPGARIKESAKIVDSNGAITYEAQIGKTDYLFDKDGNFIRRSEKKD